MKCLVCNSEFTGKACTVCGFPIVEILGDYETGMKNFQPTIEKYRNDFLKKISLSLVGYRYDVADKVSLIGQEKFQLGTAEKLMKDMTWLDMDFTNVASRTTVPVTLSVSIDDKPDYEIGLEVNNLPSEKVRLGFQVDQQLQITCELRDDSGKSVHSEPKPIIV